MTMCPICAENKFQIYFREGVRSDLFDIRKNVKLARRRRRKKLIREFLCVLVIFINFNILLGNRKNLLSLAQMFGRISII